MQRLADLPSLVSHLGAVLYAPDPLAALTRAGFELDPSVPQPVLEGLGRDVLGGAGRLAAAKLVGPTVPVSVAVGGQARTSARQPSLINGFDAAGTASLDSLVAILAKLWEGLVYPQDIPPTIVGDLYDVDLLRASFTGVPDGASLGPLLLPAPPTVHGITPDLVALTQPLRAQVLDPAGAAVELVATGTVVFPAVLHVTDTRAEIEPNGIAARTTLSLSVDPSSPLQPRDAASVEAFTTAIMPKVGLALTRVALEHLAISPVAAFPGDFSPSKVRFNAASLWLEQDRVTAGALFEPEPANETPREQPPVEALAGVAALANLTPPANVSVVLGESAIERGLRALVASGQLAEILSAKLRAIADVPVAMTLGRVEVDGVDVSVGDGVVRVGLDCRAVDACAFNVDFDFRATVHLRPEVVNGELRLPSDGIDLDLDNTDTVFCLLTAILTGPIQFFALLIGSVLAAVLTTPFNKRKPGFWQGERLPGSDVSPRLDLVHVNASEGMVSATGTFALVPDEATTFIVVQVLALDEASGLVTPVPDAVVELMELGEPPPAGDDYVPVAATTTEHFEHGSLVTITTSNKVTFPDVHLGTASTERHGFVRFAVLPDAVGGVMSIKTVVTRTNDQTTTEHSERPAGGDAPDLAVTVTLPDGYRPIERQLIALNLPDRRLGTYQDPVRVVYADRCQAERQAVAATAGQMQRIQASIDELRAELERVPPSEQEPIRKSIRRMETEFLQPAIAAHRAALDARDACRAR